MQVLGSKNQIFGGVAIVTELDRGQDPTRGSCPPPPPLGPPGGVTGTGGGTGSLVLGAPPGARYLRFPRKPCRGSPESPGVPQRPRGGGVREKDPGPPEGPRKVPRCLVVLGLLLRALGVPQRTPMSRASRTQGPPGLQPWGFGVPGGLRGPFPSRPWRPPGLPRPSGDWRGDGGQLVMTKQK